MSLALGSDISDRISQNHFQNLMSDMIGRIYYHFKYLLLLGAKTAFYFVKSPCACLLSNMLLLNPFYDMMLVGCSIVSSVARREH